MDSKDWYGIHGTAVVIGIRKICLNVMSNYSKIFCVYKIYKKGNFSGFHRVALSSTVSRLTWNLGVLFF